MRIFVAFLLFLTCRLCADDRDRPYQVLASHIEPKGIGYKEGYTSLAAFFTWPQKSGEFALFCDARGHIFNKGKPAANGGLGIRYQWMSRLYGINGYYDFRQSRANYNQVSLGLESLGERWDFRINGYLPVGNTKKIYDSAFCGLRNGSLLFSRREEMALSCMQTEVMFHLDKSRLPYSFSIGSYWMNRFDENAWGGEIRFTIRVWDYVWVEGNASYDNLFQWIGQGRFSVVVPFGPRKKDRKTYSLNNLRMRRTSRREIIPLDRKSVRTVVKVP